MRKILERLVKSLKLPERVIARDHIRPGRCYLRRYYLLGNPEALAKYFPQGSRPRWWQKLFTWLPTIYLHRFESSDADEELHNHPWTATSIILAGGYVEQFRSPNGVDRRVLRPGSVNRIGPNTFHRVLLIEEDCWSLIVVGKRVQGWGFWHPETGEFLEWREFIAKKERERREREEFWRLVDHRTSSGGLG